LHLTRTPPPPPYTTLLTYPLPADTMADTAPLSNFHEVTSPEHFQSLLSADLNRVSLINFWAPWAAPCAQMNDVVRELARKYSQLLVLQVEAESQSDIAESFEIDSVPSFIILRGHTLLGRIAGADAIALTNTIATHLRGPTAGAPLSHTAQATAAPEKFETQEGARCAPAGAHEPEPRRAVHEGLPRPPAVRLLAAHCRAPARAERRLLAFRHLYRRERPVWCVTLVCAFIYERRRLTVIGGGGFAGLKVLNNWPTFPQLIINGEFVGGLDIVQEMVENGEMKELLA
ncbi:hypothetical protein EVG20_g7213, partial [Dentipellis fragilis]